MKYQRIQKDLNKRKFFLKNELKQLLLLSMSNNTLLTPSIRVASISRLQKKGHLCSSTKIKNRCVLTGRGKAVYRTFKISRLMLRQLASNGYINGIRKASW